MCPITPGEIRDELTLNTPHVLCHQVRSGVVPEELQPGEVPGWTRETCEEKGAAKRGWDGLTVTDISLSPSSLFSTLVFLYSLKSNFHF